jgi:dTDP-4-amino-4,6-dideoxygalactose transaminase
MTLPLYFANPKAQFDGQRADIEAAVQRVFEGGTYIQGPAHEAFERAFADYVGVPHAIGVANGTDALVIAMLALGIRHDDRVLVPSHTASPTVSAIRQVGAVPKFLDVDERSYVITVETVKAALSENVKAVIPVHLYGRPADVVGLRAMADEVGIVVIEDCAQAAGARIGTRQVGSIGHAGCFSFFPTKNLGAIGDGGMITVSEAEAASRLRRLRTFGWSKDRVCVEDGFNSRLDELQAAILGVKLPELDRSNERRRDIARRYHAGLRDLPLDLPENPEELYHVYHLFVIAVDDRAELMARLNAEGIVAGIHYPIPNHLHPAHRPFVHGALDRTERLAKRVLSLPMYPELTPADVDRVITVIRTHYKVQTVSAPLLK